MSRSHPSRLHGRQSRSCPGKTLRNVGRSQRKDLRDIGRIMKDTERVRGRRCDKRNAKSRAILLSNLLSEIRIARVRVDFGSP